MSINSHRCRRCRCSPTSSTRPASDAAPALALVTFAGCTERGAPRAGLNRVFYANAEVDRLIESAASAPDDAQRQTFYTRAQQVIAEDVPYIGLWYRTNIAVFQPDIRGVQLSPIADFTFLKDVSRQPR